MGQRRRGEGAHTHLDADEPREVERLEQRYEGVGPVHVGEARKHVHHLPGKGMRRRLGVGSKG